MLNWVESKRKSAFSTIFPFFFLTFGGHLFVNVLPKQRCYRSFGTFFVFAVTCTVGSLTKHQLAAYLRMKLACIHAQVHNKYMYREEAFFTVLMTAKLREEWKPHCWELHAVWLIVGVNDQDGVQHDLTICDLCFGWHGRHAYAIMYGGMHGYISILSVLQFLAWCWILFYHCKLMCWYDSCSS